MFVNNLVPYGTRASTMWVIPLFGQAVNKKRHFVDACGQEKGGGGEGLNPASLMTPLCLEWQLQASVNIQLCVISPIRAVLCVHTNTPGSLCQCVCDSVWPGAGLWLC